MEEEAPDKRNEVAVLPEHVLVLIPPWALQLNPPRPKGNGAPSLIQVTVPPLPSLAPLHQILVKMEEEAPNKRSQVAVLPDHVLVLILRRLTAHSLCNYECVCRSWNRVFSESKYRKELPQILSGFFYRSWKGRHNLISFTGEFPFLAFLPFPICDVVITHCCRGLILCWCVGFRYIVYNLVTKKWWLLSDNNQSFCSARLGFDPTVSSHFHVIEYGTKRAGEFVGVSIYLFKSAAWMFKEFEWGKGVVCAYLTSVFLNGFMHWLEVSQIVAVDMHGKTWRKFRRPRGEAISIHEAQGQLCLCTSSMFRRPNELSFWIQEDYDTDKWTLKHRVTMLEIFGLSNIPFGYDVCDADYRVIAVHLEWDLIFLVGEHRTLIAYDMNRRKVLALPA